MLPFSCLLYCTDLHVWDTTWGTAHFCASTLNRVQANDYREVLCEPPREDTLLMHLFSQLASDEISTNARYTCDASCYSTQSVVFCDTACTQYRCATQLGKYTSA